MAFMRGPSCGRRGRCPPVRSVPPRGVPPRGPAVPQFLSPPPLAEGRPIRKRKRPRARAPARPRAGPGFVLAPLGGASAPGNPSPGRPRLLPQPELVDERLVAGDVDVAEVVEGPPPLADQLEEAAAAVVV